MMRIKLFGLFIAFALLALVRPRKCLELLAAADAGAKAQADKDLIERQNALVQQAPEEDIGCLREQAAAWMAVAEALDLVCHGWRESKTPARCMDLAVNAIKNMDKTVLLSESEMEKYEGRKGWSLKQWVDHVGGRETPEQEVVFGSWMAVSALFTQYGQQLVRRAYGVDPQCTLPPPGWRCTRAAGHDGPCAAVEVDDVRSRCAAVMGWRDRWKGNQDIAGADMLAMLNEIEALRAELTK